MTEDDLDDSGEFVKSIITDQCRKYRQNQIYFMCKGKHCLYPEKTTEKSPKSKYQSGKLCQIIWAINEEFSNRVSSVS